MENYNCEKIIREYYQIIYNYCYSQLAYDHFAADDCTQDVFLIFIRKHKRLDLGGNIKLWLYRTADYVIKSYVRKSKKCETADIFEYDAAVENGFEIKCETTSLDALSQEEYRFIQEYYGTDSSGRAELAVRYGITVGALYKRIHSIKKKLER